MNFGTDEPEDSCGDEMALELEAVSRMVDQALDRLRGLAFKNDSNCQSFIDKSLKIGSSVALLIKYATKSQEEIVAHVRGSKSPEKFYKKNSRLTRGLISAAHSVASTIVLLSETADGVANGTHTIEQLIVASGGSSDKTACGSIQGQVCIF